jgi:hypothetical protein
MMMLAMMMEAGSRYLSMRSSLVPPTGLEPALHKELHPKCSASTNSAKGAYDVCYILPDSASTLDRFLPRG